MGGVSGGDVTATGAVVEAVGLGLRVIKASVGDGFRKRNGPTVVMR